MKKISILLIIPLIFLSACDVWSVQPPPQQVWTPIPSQTPGIVTATPILLTLPFTQTPGIIIITTNTEAASPTVEPTQTSFLVTSTSTPEPAVSLEILGCNTSIDISHGMGEVTNAFIRLRNNGTANLPQTCALLRAIDEGREHPDKKVCVPDLPPQNQVTLKLTVDSAYKQDTAIQVDVSSNETLLFRTDKPSCTDIALFGSTPSDLGVIKLFQP